MITPLRSPLVGILLLTGPLFGSWAVAAAAAPSAPEPVSPGAASVEGIAEAAVESRCPTFSWAGVEGAGGYELVVFAVPEGTEASSGELELVTRASVSAGARAWTPSLGECLARGGRYAWSVRAVIPSGEGPWSKPALFQVAAGPSVEEVEAALETLRRYREEMGEAAAEQGEIDRHGERELRADRDAAAVEWPASLPADRELVTDLSAVALEQAGSPELVQVSAPVLGSPSLSVSANIALGAESNFFKEGEPFLWGDLSNTALGRLALANNEGPLNNTAVGRAALYANTSGVSNTALGRGALTNNTSGSSNTALGASALLHADSGHGNTAVGADTLANNNEGDDNTAIGRSALVLNTSGSWNTAAGTRALRWNEDGHSNTAAGFRAMEENSTGSQNTAVGLRSLSGNVIGNRNSALGQGALRDNLSGGRNVAVGYRALTNNTEGNDNVAIGNFAGQLTTGSDNVLIANTGTAAEAGTIRIGTQGTHGSTFVAGVHGTTVSGSGVLVTSDGQLGVASSSARFKEAIEELGEVGEGLASLRPVRFHYRSEAVGEGSETVSQVGLLAEEVAELFPELVARDAEGRPFSVRYDLLSVLLLGELQREQLRNEARERSLAALRQRVTTLERGDGL